MSSPAKPSLVFCHGILADGSCFNKVMPTFQAEGHEVISAQYGLDSNEADVAATRAYLGQVSSPAILIGHSYGGAVITAAGIDDRVVGLVYISAIAPDSDETSQSQQEKFPATPLFGKVQVADGRVWMPWSATSDFCGDLSEAEQKIVYATAAPPSTELFARNAPGVAWKTKPSWYIVANHDRAVNPELERFVAKRMNATTYDIDSSHVPMLSHPDFVINVIRDAINGVQG
jgi:pimeloyl-ACP methyl ester carboxylesterase